MANDVVSRIVLQAQGGDQAAREIGKTTKAFKEAGQAAQGVQGGAPGGGVSFDAFNKAVGTGNMPGPSGANNEHNSRTNDRQNNHFARFGGAGGARGLTTATGAASTALSGNAVGGMSQGMGALAGAGVAGAIAAGVAAAVLGVQKLAAKSDDRVAQIGHGLFQKLGVGDYESMTGAMTALKRDAFPEASLVPYLQSIGAGGGSMPSTDFSSWIGRRIIGEGVGAGTFGSLIASRQKAGMGVDERQMEIDISRGRAGFGQGGIEKFLGTVASSIEGAMSRGISKGAYSSTNAYEQTRFLSTLGMSEFGNMTAEGATTAFNQVQQSVAGSQSLGRSQDVFQFMNQRKAGESYGQTVRRMSGPGGEHAMYQSLKSQAGGNQEMLEILVQEQFGVDWQAVPGLIKSFEAKNLPRTALQSGTGINDPDDFIIEVGKRTGADIGVGPQKWAAEALNFFYEGLFGGRRTLTPEQEAAQAVVGGGYGGRGSTLSAMQSRLGDMPAGMDGFADKVHATGQYRDTMVGSQLLPQMAMYQKYLSGGEMAPGEKEMMDEYGFVFDGVLQALKNPVIAEQLSTRAGMVDFSNRVKAIDEAQSMDSLAQLYTIAELMAALVEQFDLEMVDTGTTE